MAQVVGDAVSFQHLSRVAIDESEYSLTPDEQQFYKSITGISDDAELKRHILDIQRKAFKVFPYFCIRRFMFTKLKVSHYPAYAHVLEHGRTHPDAIFLELACCFGNDARKAAQDGYPAKNIIATDLRREFWDLGFSLFKDSPTTWPAPFLEGDFLSSDFLDVTASKLSAQPDLAKLDNLTGLLGHVSIIHASAFFHLFSEADQRIIAERCVALIKRIPGATIFGSHMGAPDPGIYDNMGGANRKMFCHSPGSWEILWKELFGETKIKVTAALKRSEVPKAASETEDSPAAQHRNMVWSVIVI